MKVANMAPDKNDIAKSTTFIDIERRQGRLRADAVVSVRWLSTSSDGPSRALYHCLRRRLLA